MGLFAPSLALQAKFSLTSTFLPEIAVYNLNETVLYFVFRSFLNESNMFLIKTQRARIEFIRVLPKEAHKCLYFLPSACIGLVNEFN